MSTAELDANGKLEKADGRVNPALHTKSLDSGISYVQVVLSGHKIELITPLSSYLIDGAEINAIKMMRQKTTGWEVSTANTCFKKKVFNSLISQTIINRKIAIERRSAKLLNQSTLIHDSGVNCKTARLNLPFVVRIDLKVF